MTEPTPSPIEEELFLRLPVEGEAPEPYGADLYYREQGIAVEVSTNE